jgi:hypothetical protein
VTSSSSIAGTALGFLMQSAANKTKRAGPARIDRFILTIEDTVEELAFSWELQRGSEGTGNSALATPTPQVASVIASSAASCSAQEPHAPPTQLWGTAALTLSVDKFITRCRAEHVAAGASFDPDSCNAKATVSLEVRSSLPTHALRSGPLHGSRLPLTRLTKGVLQSALQKGVRRGRPAPDVRALASELWRRDQVDGVRRLLIIAVEDSALHPAAPLLVWMMLAHAAGVRELGPVFEGAFIAIAAEVAACPWADEEACMRRPAGGGEGSDGGGSAGDSSAGGEAAAGDEATANFPVAGGGALASLPPPAAGAAVPAEAVAPTRDAGCGTTAAAAAALSQTTRGCGDPSSTPSRCWHLQPQARAAASPAGVLGCGSGATGAASAGDVLVWSLLAREGYGAMGGDRVMLLQAAAVWTRRLQHAGATRGGQVAAASHSAGPGAGAGAGALRVIEAVEGAPDEAEAWLRALYYMHGLVPPPETPPAATQSSGATGTVGQASSTAAAAACAAWASSAASSERVTEVSSAGEGAAGVDGGRSAGVGVGTSARQAAAEPASGDSSRLGVGNTGARELRLHSPHSSSPYAPSSSSYARYLLPKPHWTAESTPPPSARGFVLEGVDFHCRPDMGPALLRLPFPRGEGGRDGGSSSSSAGPSSTGGVSGGPVLASALAAKFCGVKPGTTLSPADAESGLAAFKRAMWFLRSGVNVRRPMPSSPQAMLAQLLPGPMGEAARRAAAAAAATAAGAPRFPAHSGVGLGLASSSTAGGAAGGIAARLPPSRAPLTVPRWSEAEATERARSHPAVSGLVGAWDAAAPAVRQWCVSEVLPRLRKDMD